MANAKVPGLRAGPFFHLRASSVEAANPIVHFRSATRTPHIERAETHR